MLTNKAKFVHKICENQKSAAETALFCHFISFYYGRFSLRLRDRAVTKYMTTQ